MSDATSSGALPPTIARVLSRFQSMGREEKMQALVHYSKKLEPLPEKFRELDRGDFSVPECQTRVDLFPEYARRKVALLCRPQRQAIADDRRVSRHPLRRDQRQPPETTLAIPGDFVSQLMEGIGLSGREVGLNAMVGRIKALREAQPSRNRRPRNDDMTESELDDLLSTPRAETVAALAACPGDVIILGAGGKMGPTLARMVRRAATDNRRVIAVSRWSSSAAERALNDAGVETIACDLLDRDAVGSFPTRRT